VSRSRGFTLHRDHSTHGVSRGWTEKMTTWKSTAGLMMVIELGEQ
jgi:hypothetical protein